MFTSKISLRRILLVTVLFITVGQLSLSLYMPALPTIAKALNVTTGEAQSSITVFLLAFGISQLFYGFLSDRFGRKPCLLVGLCILIFATILLLSFSHIFHIFLIARFFQGLGAGSVSVLARAIIRDCYPKEKLAAAFAMLIMVASLTPAVAPMIGGWIVDLFGWKMIFISLLVYVIIIALLVAFFLPETIVKQPLDAQTIKSPWAAFKELICHEYFLLCVGMIVLLYSCQILYLAICPFIFEGTFHLSAATYGMLVMVPAIGYIFGNFLVKYLNTKVTPPKQVLSGISLLLIACCCIIIHGILKFNSVNLLLGSLFMLTTGIGLAFSNIVALSLQPFPKISGSAAAVSGFLQMSGTSLVTGIVNVFHIQNIFGMGVSLLICASIICILLIKILNRVWLIKMEN